MTPSFLVKFLILIKLFFHVAIVIPNNIIIQNLEPSIAEVPDEVSMDGDDGSTPMEEATTNTITNGMAQIPLPRYFFHTFY